MKSILTTAILFFAILNGVQSQTMEKEYWNYLQVKDPKQIQRFEWRLFPKPLEVRKTHNKVIVIWDRKEWERAQFMHSRRGMMRRPGPMVYPQPMPLQKRPELNLPKEDK